MPLRALALRPPPLPSAPLLRAEARVRALLADVLELEREREELESALGGFSMAWERELGAALAEAEEAARLVRRLRRLEEELDHLADATAAGPAEGVERGRGPSRRRAEPLSPRRRAGAPFGARAAGDAAARRPASADLGRGRVAEWEPEELALKRLHRRLARAIHPDLARGDRERASFAAWMARVNAAYHARDLVALEVLAEKIGVGAAPGAPTEAERLARLERRALALETARDSVARDLDRLRASEAFRLRAESARRVEDGGDLVAETRVASAERLAALGLEALARYDSAAARAQRLERTLNAAGGSDRDRSAAHPPSRPPPSRSPLARSPLARRALVLAEIPRPGPRALELARELSEAALASDPWQAALTLLAFYSEVGGRPPDGLARAAPLAERWDALRAGWPSAPDLPRALARLPRHLEIGGLRFGRGGVAAGLQLSTADALAGVRHALASGGLRALARDVLAVCGPRERCDGCEAGVFAVHLLRTRGLDEVHGVVCPRCGSVLRSYLRYGDAEGLEALAPLALEVGLVDEAHVRFGRRTVAFQMLPMCRAVLTSERLAALVHALYVKPYGLPLQPRHLALQPHGVAAPLAPDAAVPPGASVKLRLSGAALREAEAIAWVKDRIAERFRR